MRSWVTAILLTILPVLSGCRTPATMVSATAQPSPAIISPTTKPPLMTVTPIKTPLTVSATPDAVLTHVQGEVRVQQVITGQSFKASFGNPLWRGDVIVAGQEAQGEVICSDGKVLRIEANQSLTITCGETPDRDPDIILNVQDEQLEALLSPRPLTGDESLPVILEPRSNTHLIDERPTIRWQAVEGAETYEVVVSDLKSELWRDIAQQPVLPYPQTKPPLQAGVSYLIQVTARSGEQSRPLKNAWVTMLPAPAITRLHQFETRLKAFKLSAESVRFAMALYYIDQELYDAAITELVSLAGDTSSPAIYRLLGYAYWAVELSDEAAQCYHHASRLAQAENNRLIQAEAEVGLGHIAYARKNFAAALNHYQAAQILYREVGLEHNAEVVATPIAKAQAYLFTPTP